MSLVCLACGYKQYDMQTILEFRKRFPGLEDHDIPYYCGACQDNAGEELWAQMLDEMRSSRESALLESANQSNDREKAGNSDENI